MRVTIGSRPGTFGGRISPVRRRPLKTESRRCAGTNLGSNGQQPERRCKTARAVAEAEFGGRDRILADLHPVLDYRQFLVRNAHDDRHSRRMRRRPRQDASSRNDDRNRKRRGLHRAAEGSVGTSLLAGFSGASVTPVDLPRSSEAGATSVGTRGRSSAWASARKLRRTPTPA